jgi:hypothetical protein
MKTSVRDAFLDVYQMTFRYIHATNPSSSSMLFFESGCSRNACALLLTKVCALLLAKVCASNLSQGVCVPSLSLCSFIDLMVSLAGRIWWFRFYIPESSNGSCRAVIGLSQHSYQARFNAVLLIEAHSRKPDRTAPPEALKISLSLTDTNRLALVPWQ